MIVKMLTSIKGSNDGLTLKQFVSGEKYSTPNEISEDLARVFLNEGFSIEDGVEVKLETKVIEKVETLRETEFETQKVNPKPLKKIKR